MVLIGHKTFGEIKFFSNFAGLKHQKQTNMQLLMAYGTEILIIAILILLLFGGKKIPELMKGIGKGVKSYKDGLNGVEDPNETKKTEDKKE